MEEKLCKAKPEEELAIGRPLGRVRRRPLKFVSSTDAYDPKADKMRFHAVLIPDHDSLGGKQPYFISAATLANLQEGLSTNDGVILAVFEGKRRKFVERRQITLK